MNALSEIEKMKLDEAQFAVLGTVLSGVLDGQQALDAAKMVKQSGGLFLFDSEWSCEAWRRIDAALNDRKLPTAYRSVKQVQDLPGDLLAKIMDSTVPVGLVEEVYIPELVRSARERQMRRAMKEAAEGGDIDKALEACKEAKRLGIPAKSKAQLCNEALDDWTEALKRPGQISGIPSGLIDLDKLTWGWQNENLIILGARPSQGKTAILLGFCREAAIKNQIPTLFITLESSPKELLKRLACQIAGADQSRLRGGMPTQGEMAALAPAFSKIHSSPIWFADCSGMSINQIKGAASRMIVNYGIKLVVVDYLTKIRPDEKHEKRTYEVAQASEGLKVLAKEMNVPVISAAQLNREPEKNKGRMPVLSDLADSGQIERDADIVGLLHKDANGGMFLILAKFRDGPTGIISLAFNPSSARFDNAARETSQPYKD